MTQSPKPDQQEPPRERSGTLIETDDDIRQASLSGHKSEYWIGSDPSCPICRADDPFCEPKHVRLYRASRGGWHAEQHKTPNGLWLRMQQIIVESLAQFQIGEQRFQLKVK
jgi:hypothetical protein